MHFKKITNSKRGWMTLLMCFLMYLAMPCALAGNGHFENEPNGLAHDASGPDKENFLTQLPPDKRENNRPAFQPLLIVGATDMGDQVRFNWVLPYSELGNSELYFEIQRSANGRKFESIGYSATELMLDQKDWRCFEYLDTDPYEGKNYYRLAQFNAEGQVFYSKIIMTDVKVPSILNALVESDATEHDIHLLVFSNTSGKVSVELFNAGELTSNRTEFYVDAGLNDLYFTPANSAPGIYNLRISGQGNQQIERVVLHEKQEFGKPEMPANNNIVSFWLQRACL